jgi:hypothetical protein
VAHETTLMPCGWLRAVSTQPYALALAGLVAGAEVKWASALR